MLLCCSGATAYVIIADWSIDERLPCLQPGVDEGLELLAAEIVRMPHRIESSGLSA